MFNTHTESVTDSAGSNRPVVLFDGVCNLCEGSVRWIIKRDPEAMFSFSPLQSGFSQSLIDRHRDQLDDFDVDSLDSFILVVDGRILMRSEAWLYIVSHLPGASRLLGILRWVPPGLRDRVYDFIGSHRYRWFGEKEQCMVPTPEISGRFIR